MLISRFFGYCCFLLAMRFEDQWLSSHRGFVFQVASRYCFQVASHPHTGAGCSLKSRTQWTDDDLGTADLGTVTDCMCTACARCLVSPCPCSVSRFSCFFWFQLSPCPFIVCSGRGKLMALQSEIWQKKQRWPFTQIIKNRAYTSNVIILILNFGNS